MATNQLMPLRYGTRQRIQPLKSVPYDAANVASIELPRVGLLAALVVNFNGLVDTDAAYVPSARAPFSLVDRFTLTTNQGTATVFDVDGYGTELIARTHAPGFCAKRDDTRLVATPASGAANGRAVRATWYIPLSMNNGVEFNQGMINLQAPEIQVVLNIRAASGQALAKAGAVSNVRGNFSVDYLYYEIPDPRMFAMPPLTIVRWLQESQLIGATGEQIFTIPRQGTLMNLIQRVELDGIGSDSWDNIGIRFNKTDNPYTISAQTQRLFEAMRYDEVTPSGVVYWDFASATSVVNSGDARDMIDTEELSTTEFFTTISSNAVLGAAGNRLVNIRRILQVLE